MLVTRDPFTFIVFPPMEVNGCCQLSDYQIFFQITSFVFNRRKKLIPVWNNLRVSK